MNIEIKKSRYPFFQLSSQQDLTLFLIKKELQGNKFMDGLEKLGFDRFTYESGLGCVILSLMGYEITDEVFENYYETLDKYVEAVNLDDNQSVSDLVLEFYMEMVNSNKVD